MDQKLAFVQDVVIIKGQYLMEVILSKRWKCSKSQKSSTPIRNSYTKRNPVQPVTQAVKEVIRFSDDMNKAINSKQACLVQAESEMLQLEENFSDGRTDFCWQVCNRGC